ncbi:hypothetical protein P691DRAFT_790606 [Macrolepiota fuliginosa MF-IS2]|uniref:Myb/SANT-like domain-containing protein n=1 Tax=Macrolepiota fuliginosa MF-IS2 TaxID=1400762 RepID=A0A9P5WZE2_9AGAR|nr:hypothetical protein P691DRAFT_790606 [Macrolepiota fuliginosa MF-IS2]
MDLLDFLFQWCNTIPSGNFRKANFGAVADYIAKCHPTHLLHINKQAKGQFDKLKSIYLAFLSYNNRSGLGRTGGDLGLLVFEEPDLIAFNSYLNDLPKNPRQDSISPSIVINNGSFSTKSIC